MAERPRPPVRLTRADVQYLSVSTPFRVPEDALVLVAGERPGESWYYLALWILLGGFVALNAVALVGWLRAARRGA